MIASPASRCHSMWPMRFRNDRFLSRRRRRVERTVEEPDSWIISGEAQGRARARLDLDCVAADRVSLALDERWVQSRVIRGVIRRASDDLEFMSVQMAEVLRQ